MNDEQLRNELNHLLEEATTEDRYDIVEEINMLLSQESIHPDRVTEIKMKLDGWEE